MQIDDLWSTNAIIYCMDVEKLDSNGDGIGDFGGAHAFSEKPQALDVDARAPLASAC